MNNCKTQRDLREKQNRIERVFPDREIFDYAICLLHLAVSLFSIHAKNVSFGVRHIMPFRKTPHETLAASDFFHYIGPCEKIKPISGNQPEATYARRLRADRKSIKFYQRPL
jgi:hypothetical protein